MKQKKTGKGGVRFSLFSVYRGRRRFAARGEKTRTPGTGGENAAKESCRIPIQEEIPKLVRNPGSVYNEI
jgi:hypothetical protein